MGQVGPLPKWLILTGHPHACCLPSVGPQVPPTWAFPQASRAPRGTDLSLNEEPRLSEPSGIHFFFSYHASEVTEHQPPSIHQKRATKPSPDLGAEMSLHLGKRYADIF